MSYKEEILNGLNNVQQTVVKSIYGKYAVAACPGSGKTRCMVHRAAYMIAEGISPANILIFTFTRKAAGKLKERVQELIGVAGKGMTVCTYHSFCAKTLRTYASLIGRTNLFSIYTDTEKNGVISRILKQESYTNIKLPEAAKEISNYKENLITTEAASARASVKGSERQINIADIYMAYQNTLKECNALDYDDLIFQTIMLIKNNESVCKAINEQYKYVIADEFQDSSIADLELIRLLAGEDPDRWNLCCVLDDDQSIYSFRGSNIIATMAFIDRNNLTKINMGQNYRSTKAVVQASHGLILHNQVRFEKEMFTDKEDGAPIIFYSVSDNFKEAAIVSEIVEDCIDRGYQYRDIAILYRMNNQSYDVENAFIKKKIPHVILRGTAFSKRREIQDIMAYVLLTVNSRDREAFKRIINTPERFVGEKTIESIEALLEAKPFLNVLEACSAVNLKISRTKQGVESFVTLMRSFQETAGELQNNTFNDTGARKLVEEIISKTEYDKYIEEKVIKSKAEFYERLGNLEKLKEIAQYSPSIEDFIDQILSVPDTEQDPSNENYVTLSTMHSAKGLEWPIVIIIGCNEGTSPSFMDIKEGGIEESRRLFYVAMTRAKNELFLTRSKNVLVRGKWSKVERSRFIREIPHKFMVER